MFNLAIAATVIVCAIPLIFLVAFGLTISGVPMIISVILPLAFFGATSFYVIRGIAQNKPTAA